MENFKTLIESTKYPQLSRSDSEVMRILLGNAAAEHQRMINENTLSGDVAQFTPILMPLIRESYPQLVANELLGVQPLTTPTGYIYAIINRLTGDSATYTGTSKDVLRVVEFDRPLAELSLQVAPVAGVLAVEGQYALVHAASFVGSNGTAGLTGTVELVQKTGATVATANTATKVFSNQTLLSRLFKNYTGPILTGQAELLGNSMKEIGFTIERKSIEAKSRNLKGKYSVEMFQDLKSQHGLAADEELISLMSNEIRSEINQEVIGFINSNATISASDFALAGTLSASNFPVQARWEIEQYRRLGVKIAKEAAEIGIQTRRAQGNKLLLSPQVAVALQQLGTFSAAPQANGMDNTAIGGVIGTFDGRYDVVVDQYATEDYVTVLYKGIDRRDAMGVFAPYVPLSFIRVTDPNSGQPAIIAKTRYALETMPDIHNGSTGLNDPKRGSRYARTFGVDLTGTALA